MNASLLEKINELQEEIADFVEFLYQKYVAPEEEASARTPEGEVIIGYDADGEPLLASKAKILFFQRIEAMDKGEFITIEQLREAMIDKFK